MMIPDNMMSDEELRQLMRNIQESLDYIVEDYLTEEESAVAIATLCMKTAIRLYRGVMTDEEVISNLNYGLLEFKELPPILPENIKRH